MRIIAFYLPQFHSIPENDEWWGKDFTEWTNVKKAKPLFEGHIQPKIPLNNNYYNLLDDNVKIWQANLAKEYGIYGFCYYHYWYNGHMLLEKPMEQMLKNKKIDIPFCIWWCNQPWTKSWVGNDKKVLIAQKYGDKDEWIEHYKYLRQFFLDDRYIFNDNKPVLGIYQPEMIVDLDKMSKCWQELAKKDGFDGIDLMCTIKNYNGVASYPSVYENFNHFVEWGFSLAVTNESKFSLGGLYSVLKKIKEAINVRFQRLFGRNLITNGDLIKLLFNKKSEITKYNYDKIWEKVISLRPYCEKSLPGAFVDWDNTARYGKRGSVMINSSPDKFSKYLSEQIKNAKNYYKTDLIFLQAWNEWAEWSVLEPDEYNEYNYINGVKKALIANNEFKAND